MNYDEMFYKYGLFSEYIPTCFNSDLLYKKIDKLKTSYQKSLSSECEELAIYKTDTTRRVIKVPNPEQYVYLCETLKDSIEDIKNKINKNSNTESNHFRKNGAEEFLDIPLYCEIMNIKSNFTKSVKERMRYSMGYKYELKIDLSKFYESIYTHIIEWCVIGKKNAKKRIGNNWGKELDVALRKGQSDETKGIPTGPITSRIISEYILSFIDEELNKHGFVFKHYVDDYKFYFKTEDEAILGLKTISNIFREYRLNINEEKTKIIRYPFDIQSNLNQVMYLGRKINDKESIIYVINECNRLYDEGIESSYKYILKSLRKLRTGDLAQWIYLESFFLSVLTIKPDLARFISSIILKYKILVTEEFLVRLKEILVNNIKSKNECEILWVFWLLITLGCADLTKEILIDLLKIENDFIKIMTIDYIKHYNISIQEINIALKEIENELEELSLNDTNWLLVYESVVKKWFSNVKIEQKVKNNNFYKTMLKQNVDFYTIKY